MARKFGFWAVLLMLSGPLLWAQSVKEADKLDLPGDNLNLYAVMKLFQESPTLEEFERKLNLEESKINNLDLNGDDKIDYIKVNDDVEGNVHTIILQVATAEKENQDIAVFVVEKKADGAVEIQLIGDEELYGKDYIIEPNMTAQNSTGSTPNPGYKPKTAEDGQPIIVNNTTTQQISLWPVVRFIFLPSYVIWRSPWHWGYYPGWWNPWRPFYWHQYYGWHYHWHYHYFGHYRRWTHYRWNNWYGGYYSRRRTVSVIVIDRRKRGDYRQTYSRPETLREGSNLYKKNYPDRIVNNRLPTPSTERPGVARPSTRPTTPSVQRPTNDKVRPSGSARPSPGGNTRPAIRPAVPQPTTRPSVTRPTPTRPVTRPATGTGNGSTNKSKRRG